MIEAKLYQKIENQKIRCSLCNHHCLILKGKTGICGVRLNKNGKLFSLVYDRPVAVHIDPVEKKPLYHFMAGTNTFSFGTFGCNFRCDWCQNWEISQFTKQTVNRKQKTVDTTQKINSLCDFVSPKKIITEAKKFNCPSVSYTYTEPTIFFEYALATMKLAHKSDLKNIWVSNGYFSEKCFKKIEPYLDAINVDFKSFDNKIYQKYCGARLEPVLDNLERISAKGRSASGGNKAKHIHLEITTLLIPSINDDEKQFKKIAQFIASLDKNIPWHLSRFFPCYKMEDTLPTPISTLKKAQKIGRKAGLKYVYLGNI